MAEKTRVFYLHDKRNFPVTCVASRLAPNNQVEFAICTHNPVDKFEHGYHRTEALKRLSEGKISGRVPAEPGAIKLFIAASIAADVLAPYRAQRAAFQLATKLANPPRKKQKSMLVDLVTRVLAESLSKSPGSTILGFGEKGHQTRHEITSPNSGSTAGSGV